MECISYENSLSEYRVISQKVLLLQPFQYLLTYFTVIRTCHIVRLEI